MSGKTTYVSFVFCLLALGFTVPGLWYEYFSVYFWASKCFAGAMVTLALAFIFYIEEGKIK